MIKPLALFILAVVVALILNQCRKPRWFPGRLLLWNMNHRHSALTDWGLEHAPVATSRTILDVGCGGGMTVRKLCKSSGDSKVFGIDLSSTSVNSSRKLNADLIKAGRVEIEQSGVSSLSFPDGTVDLITAVETHYYWPNLPSDLQEIHRVLKPGGYFLIIAETYKGMRNDLIYRLSMSLLRGAYLGPSDYRELLTTAGYSKVDIFTNDRKGWICTLARK